MSENSAAPRALLKNPLLFYIRQNQRSFVLGMIFLIITNSLDAAYPLFIKKVLDEVTAQGLPAILPNGFTPSSEAARNIGLNCGLFFLTMLGLAITRYCWRLFFGRYHTEAAEDLRNRIFKHLTTMGPSFFMKNSVGELLSVLVSDVQSFRNAIGAGVLIFFDGTIIIAIVLPLMIWLEPSWTWKTLIFLPLIPFMIKQLTKIIFATFKTQQTRLAELSGVSQEIVSGIRVIKSFAQESNRLKFYNRYNASYEEACLQTARWDALFMPVMEFGVASGSVILLFVAGPDVFSGAATIGTLVAFQRYISKMVWPMTALGMGYSQYQKGMASFSRIREIFTQQTDIPDNGHIELSQFKDLEVKNLSFRFPDGTENVLENINFQIKAGELVGLVGPVGSGKTTLLHLLTRLYPAQPGQVLVNGISLEQIRQENLHSLISMVPQEAFLFSETIAENMAFGLTKTQSEGEATTELTNQKILSHWATAVDIENEISHLPQGFNSQLGERGVNLSGGQKQRLTIARSLITNAPVVLLDDSLSAVDVNTENKIKGSLKNLEHNQSESNEPALRTRIIVAHRISSIENSDKIIVLNEGKVAAIGKHADLLKSCEIYQKMALIQGYGL